MIHILTIILISTDVTCTTISHVGSAIFHNKRSKHDCWSEDELATLRVRRVVERAMPTNVSPEKINDSYLKEMLIYFRQALGNSSSDADPHSATLIKNALADAIGAHLTREILPAVRFSYYAGYTSYRNVREAHDFLDHLKMYLNTQGLGWARPEAFPPWTNLTVIKMFVGNGKLLNSCSGLVIKRDANSCIHLPAPKLDDNTEPSAIALPFKSEGLVSLVLPGSQNILLKYYTTAARCILRNSPERCRHDDFLNFNNEMWHWMKRSVAPHLGKEKLYSAFGGILRIAAAVQSYGKGLSRRNLFEDDEEDGNSKWQPWKAITDTYVYIDPDWTPSLYILMVVLAAAAICLSQICYSLIFGKDNGCRCVNNHFGDPQEENLCNVPTICPALLPSNLSPISYGDHDRVKLSRTSVKKSLRSMQSQKVYDFHENTEKIMTVIMSDNQESSEADSEVISHTKMIEHKSGTTAAGVSIRDASPPEIESSISQLKIDKHPSGKRSPVYSTSTNSRSAMTYCNEHRDSGSAWSGSSTSEQSMTSGSFKSRFKKSKNSRDLAWARRVASKASHAKSTSGTEMDVHSFTTPPSKHQS